jgi:hypothetical protein
MRSKLATPSAEASAKAILARRTEGQRYADEARAAGRPKEARQFEAIVRRFDRLIAQCGMDRRSTGW